MVPKRAKFISLQYTHKPIELTLRLGFFWTAMSIADILSALFAYGLLHMRGVHGQAGWRWLFLIEVCANILYQIEPARDAN